MLGCNVIGYSRSCASTTGGVGALYVGDANDLNFTSGAVDSNGDPTGYDTVTARGGSGASATATLTSTAVSAVTVGTGGTGFTTPPAITFTGGGGSGATAHAVLTGGVISSIVVDSGGTGYTSAPTVNIAQISGPLLFAIDSLVDSMSVDITQTNADGSSSSWAYVINAQMAQFSQKMTVFNKKIDAAAGCCQLVFVWINNDTSIFVAGEKYVDAAKIGVPFRLWQDGSKVTTGKKFTDSNGQTLSIKGTYWRMPYQFTGGIGAIDTFLSDGGA